jgi:Arc/MetJ-type ribon-helix-helix transcriptional regulator
MESLVTEEVEKQLQQLPDKIRNYVNRADVIAYALNRLPALYATSEKGWQQQRARAAKEMGARIVAAVRQAIAAVQRDPLRTVAPLQVEVEQDPLSALQGLRDLLRMEELSWKNLVDAVEYTLMKTARGEITWRKRGAAPAQKHDWQKYHI